MVATKHRRSRPPRPAAYDKSNNEANSYYICGTQELLRPPRQLVANSRKFALVAKTNTQIAAGQKRVAIQGHSLHTTGRFFERHIIHDRRVERDHHA